MKKALFLALSCLLLATMWTLPADARGKLTVINTTDTGAAIQINYYAAVCHDDHVNVAPHGRFVVNSGLCELRGFAAQLRDSRGTVHNCVWSPKNSLQAVFRIQITGIDPGKRTQNGVTIGGDLGHFCGIAAA